MADFSSLVKFMNRLSNEASLMYGRRALNAQIFKSTSKIQTTFSGKKSINSYNVIVSKPSNSNSFACFYSKESNHRLLNSKKIQRCAFSRTLKVYKAKQNVLRVSQGFLLHPVSFKQPHSTSKQSYNALPLEENSNTGASCSTVTSNDAYSSSALVCNLFLFSEPLSNPI